MSLSTEFKSFLLVPVCAGIGVAIAMILEVLNDKGLLIDEYITGSVTLADLQTIVIVIFLLFGIMIGMFRRR